MSSSSLLQLLCVSQCLVFRAAVVGGRSATLSATVGGSVLIPCSLPVNSVNLAWFYWQEDQLENILFNWHTSGTTTGVADEYRNRCQAFNAEFSHGNISISLHNVSIGDDQKTFWTNDEFEDEIEKKKKLFQHQCKSTLQVSALYQGLVLTINSTANRGTCVAHGGYPEPRVSWTGQSKSGGAQLDLRNAHMSLQQDPTKKTFSFTSTVDVKEMRSVTCRVFNPRANQTIETNADIPGEVRRVPLIIVILIILLLIVAISCWCWRKHRTGESTASANQSGGDVPKLAHEGSRSLNNKSFAFPLCLKKKKKKKKKKRDVASSSDSNKGNEGDSDELIH